VLVQEALSFEKEYYLGVTIDRAEKKVVVMGSASGELPKFSKDFTEFLLKWILL